MVAGSICLEIHSTVEAKRLWNAVKDRHNLTVKLLPEVIASFTIVEGDGGVGTIRQINFTHANKEFSCVKERVDEIDEADFVYVFSHVEGGEVGKNWASAKFTQKFTPTAEGGCVHNWTCDYGTLPGVPQDDEAREELKKARVIALFKKFEAYLLANPTLYC